MKNKIRRFLSDEFGIPEPMMEIVENAETQLTDVYRRLDDIKEYNQYKVLSAFQKCRITEMHFGWTTGYGYDDPGREALERLYAEIFGTQAAFVRPTIVNGTHALAAVYLGILRPGDELIYCTGRPYDTMETIIGLRGENQGSLKDFGITYKQVELTSEGKIDIPAVLAAISGRTRMVSVQRATGYSFREPIGIDQIRTWSEACKRKKPEIICMTDNCYGEFTQIEEPTDVGVDIMAGSLIKNPGGGLALSGGYVAGRSELIEKVACRVTAPGIGGECGLTFGQTRAMFQGMFLAPSVVNSALKGAALCAKVFQTMGYEVCPMPEAARNDVIQAIQLGSPEKIVAFCRGVQKASPVDSHVQPTAWDMPGYEDQVIMAAGTFVQGASIELSADAPMREPYVAYFQGGLTYEHAKFGVIKTLAHLAETGHLNVKREDR
ncbi:MAG: methionine gamma-lyase family protein [Eubacteriales bacterium]|jgi:cystathionine beta-lyase family protein involved in aluminum resistance|nr:methionine gamma-lyase family protein [Eubacteriales bacterium]NLV70638.1 hypothetical protein [Clostridiales bacterium]HPF18740.1 methionine gamma-lyase family protein [Bacillota bacterium]